MIRIYHFSREKGWKIPCEKWEIEIDDSEVVRLVKRIFKEG